MIVDATLIAAPSSTKNKGKKRDPEMRQTKKSNQWYYRWEEGYAYGMKVHVGVDKDSGLIHSVVVIAANIHDLTPTAVLPHGEEALQMPCLAGHTGWKAARSDRCSHSSRVCQSRAPIPGNLDEVGRRPKQQFGFKKIRLRCLDKNCHKINVLTALTNLFLVQRQLLAAAYGWEWCF
jgi:IS5 family transposase